MKLLTTRKSELICLFLQTRYIARGGSRGKGNDLLPGEAQPSRYLQIWILRTPDEIRD